MIIRREVTYLNRSPGRVRYGAPIWVRYSDPVKTEWVELGLRSSIWWFDSPRQDIHIKLYMTAPYTDATVADITSG